jgi:hypothetical protein
MRNSDDQSRSHFRLWLRYPILRKHEWQLSPLYWNSLNRVRSGAFRIRRFFFYGARSVHESSESFRAGFSLLSAVAGSFLVAAAAVLAVISADQWCGGRGGYIKGVLRLFESKVDSATFEATLSALLAMSGVLLGLYLAAVSVVASTVYARVPDNVRQILLRAKVGNFYLGALVKLASVSTLLLVAHSLGFSPGVFQLLLVSLLALAAILCFPVLALYVLRFFDPGQLTPELQRTLTNQIQNASPRGWMWRDPTFQQHYRRLASEALRTYKQLLKLIASRGFQGTDALRRAGVETLRLMRWYAPKKAKIPTNSLWFARSRQFKRLSVANSSELLLALQTGTTVQPDEIPDPLWIERELCQTLGRNLRDLGKRGDFEGANSLGTAIGDTVGYLAESLFLDEALLLLQELDLPLSAAPQDSSLSLNLKAMPEDVRFYLSVAELRGYGVVALLVGFYKALTQLDINTVKRAVSNISWKNSKTIYDCVVPQLVLQRLEWLAPRLDFELRVEGRLVSPNWYIEQLVGEAFARFLADAFKTLSRLLEESFLPVASQMHQSGRSLIAAQILFKGIEAFQKLQYYFPEVRKCHDALSQLHKVKDFPWPAVDWDSSRANLESARDKIVSALASCAVDLTEVPHPPVLPDYFGHSYSVICDECYFSMAQGNIQLFDELFPKCFAICLLAQSRARDDSQTAAPLTQAVLSIDPLVDLLELSGYAIIFDELESRNYRAIVDTTWNGYLNNIEDTTTLAPLFAAAGHLSTSMMIGMPPREMIRARWRQDVQARLRARGLPDMLSREWHDEKTRHPSPIIRAISRGSFFRTPSDVFLVCYLQGKIASLETHFTPQTKSFATTLRREKDKAANSEASTQ